MTKLYSIFTDDLSKCLVTGMQTGLEIHHVFGGWQGLRKRATELGMVVPLHYSVHPNGAYRTDKNWLELDHWLKRKCQEWYIEVAHIGNRDDWYREFGKFYDDRCDEKVWLNGKFEWRIERSKE